MFAPAPAVLILDRCLGDVRAGTGGLDSNSVDRVDRFAKSVSPPIDDVIVCQEGAIDLSSGQRVDVRRMHSVLDSFSRPRLIRCGDGRLEIDDANAWIQTFEEGQRVAPDIPRRRIPRNRPIFLFGELDVSPG